MIKKIILSTIFFAVYGALNLALHTVDTLALGIIAGDQFYNSNSASIATSFVFFLIGFLQDFMPIMLILALIVLWAEVVMEWLGKLIFPALLLLFVATHSDHALAYADPILQQIAQLRVQAGLGKGLEEHGLPIVVTPGMLEALEHLAVGAPK